MGYLFTGLLVLYTHNTFKFIVSYVNFYVLSKQVYEIICIFRPGGPRSYPCDRTHVRHRVAAERLML